MHAGGEVGVIGLGAQVVEGEHGDGLALGIRFRGRTAGGATLQARVQSDQPCDQQAQQQGSAGG